MYTADLLCIQLCTVGKEAFQLMAKTHVRISDIREGALALNCQQGFLFSQDQIRNKFHILYIEFPPWMMRVFKQGSSKPECNA